MTTPISKPMLFSGEMIRAILEDRKSQTRRIIKPQPVMEGNLWVWKGHIDCADHAPHPVGSMIWVRETFLYRNPKANDKNILYLADVAAKDVVEITALFGPWKPSIFMPKSASRITLEVTAVRVERLQDISEDDCAAEGVEPPSCNVCIGSRYGCTIPNNSPGRCPAFMAGYKRSYEILWKSINPGSWQLNPWVWVYSFRRVKP